MHKAGGRPMSDTEFADLKNGYDQGIEQAREAIQETWVDLVHLSSTHLAILCLHKHRECIRCCTLPLCV